MKKVIYGAGEFGKCFLEILKIQGEEIEFFIQTSLEHNLEIDGISVISYKNFLEHKRQEFVIYIAINHEEVVQEIKNRLQRDGYDMQKVFDMRRFLLDNPLLPETGNKKCLLCQQSLLRFFPTGEKNELFEKKNIVGGGYRENGICPYCRSSDRTRWVYWVLQNFSDIFEAQNRVIHFAPERTLREKLEKTINCDYYPADIQTQIGGQKVHKIDVLDIPFKDGFADYIIMNHVLEHIIDDKAAICEMKRVLKQSGKMIISFPICTQELTLEDASIIREEERERVYGQKDHVRLYGTDFKERLESYGLKVKIYSPKDYMNVEQIETYGFISNDIVLICSAKE